MTLRIASLVIYLVSLTLAPLAAEDGIIYCNLVCFDQWERGLFISANCSPVLSFKHQTKTTWRLCTKKILNTKNKDYSKSKFLRSQIVTWWSGERWREILDQDISIITLKLHHHFPGNKKRFFKKILFNSSKLSFVWFWNSIIFSHFIFLANIFE